uniref:Ig-like domain-containing protein n=1 Tax=Erpetoichthys calabaricus TaxID=27687 RepID=A0A8C4XCD2_ERPCA
MEYMYRVTLICLYCTPSSLTVLHTFRYLITEGLENSTIPKLTFSEMVGEDELYYYDSDNMRLIHRYNWLEGLEKFNLYLLYEMIYGLPGTIVKYKRHVLGLLNQPSVIRIGQIIVGCEIDQEDKTDWFFSHVGYNGEDLFDIDLEEHTCAILDNEADSLKEECNFEIRSYYMEVDVFREYCVLSLKEYLLFGKETLERKELPKVSLFQTASQAPSDIKLVCHVTGFFPRDIEVTWIRNEMEQLEVESGEILPNDDKTYQVRKTIIINHADLEKYKYSCHVDHTSLTKKLIVPWKSKESDLAMVVRIIIVAVVLTAVLTGIVLWKKKQAGTSRHADTVISQEELNQKNICPMLLLPFAVDKTNTPEIQEEEQEQCFQPLHGNL